MKMSVYHKVFEIFFKRKKIFILISQFSYLAGYTEDFKGVILLPVVFCLMHRLYVSPPL